MWRKPGTLGLMLVLSAGCATSSHTALLHDRYRVISTDEVDESEPTERPGPLRALARTTNSGEIFAGQLRGDPKTSVATGVLESYSTIAALRSALPAETDMLALHISSASDSERTSEEQHNVSVVGVIYAASKETDNDFHLIVGDKDCESGDCLINVEVSGLPKDPAAPDYPVLSAVRTKFETYLDQQLPGRKYKKFDPPIPVTISGSIFFDVDHAAGAIGPTGMRPSSAWEIHPLTDIKVER
jgi:hypothetical protein